jgi:ubiquinone/menaquinone biosynthesis C-methylase UbiE
MSQTVTSNRIVSEQAFFDREASALTDEDLRIADDQIARYRNARSRPTNSAKEALFATLLPLTGKRVLDYGCGTGDLACELALCGAQVTAFDVSAESIHKAQRRAEIHGVAGQMRFDVGRAGQTCYPDQSFDVVVGSAILHHLHAELAGIYAEVDRLLVPTAATACFIEPMANSATLRWLRRLVPVRCHATPDERQLYYSDFEPMRHFFDKLEMQHFYCPGRLQRILGDSISRPGVWLDYQIQRFAPVLRRHYGIVLVTARR